METINLKQNRDQWRILLKVVINKIGGSRRKNGMKVRRFQGSVLSPSSGCKNSECLCFQTYVNDILSQNKGVLAGSKLLGFTKRAGFLDLWRN